MCRKLFVWILFTLLSVSSNCYSAPRYYTFEGEVSWTNGDSSNVGDFSIGDSVSYTFMVDTDLTGYQTRHYSPSLSLPDSSEIIDDNSSLDSFYVDYIGGSEASVGPFYDREDSNGSYYFSYNFGGSYSESDSVPNYRDQLWGGTSYNTISVGERSSDYSFSDWDLGTELTGFNYAYESPTRQHTIESNLTVTNISDSNPFWSQQEPDSEPKTYGIFIEGSGTAWENFNNAEYIYNAFDNVVNFGYEDDAPIYNLNESKNEFDFSGAIEEAIGNPSQVSEEDTFILYYHGHAGKEGELFDPYSGSQALWLQSEEDGDDLDQYLWDTEFASLLGLLPEEMKKVIILDTCFAGGFWEEIEEYDYENIAFMAPVGGEQHSFLSLNGHSWYTEALVDTLEGWADGGYIGDSKELHDESLNWLYGLYEVYEGQVFPINGDPETAVVSLDDFTPIYVGEVISFNKSEPVPEPATILLLSTGLLGLVGASRKKFLKK